MQSYIVYNVAYTEGGVEERGEEEREEKEKEISGIGACAALQGAYYSQNLCSARKEILELTHEYGE